MPLPDCNPDVVLELDLGEQVAPEERERRRKAVGVYMNVLGVARVNGASWDDASASARRSYEATLEVLQRREGAQS